MADSQHGTSSISFFAVMFELLQLVIESECAGFPFLVQPMFNEVHRLYLCLFACAM
jgi:hypothetical protein